MDKKRSKAGEVGGAERTTHHSLGHWASLRILDRLGRIEPVLHSGGAAVEVGLHAGWDWDHAVHHGVWIVVVALLRAKKQMV